MGNNLAAARAESDRGPVPHKETARSERAAAIFLGERVDPRRHSHPTAAFSKRALTLPVAAATNTATDWLLPTSQPAWGEIDDRRGQASALWWPGGASDGGFM
jgi:hypothetical protein